MAGFDPFKNRTKTGPKIKTGPKLDQKHGVFLPVNFPWRDLARFDTFWHVLTSPFSRAPETAIRKPKSEVSSCVGSQGWLAHPSFAGARPSAPRSAAQPDSAANDCGLIWFRTCTALGRLGEAPLPISFFGFNGAEYIPSLTNGITGTLRGSRGRSPHPATKSSQPTIKSGSSGHGHPAAASAQTARRFTASTYVPKTI